MRNRGIDSIRRGSRHSLDVATEEEDGRYLDSGERIDQQVSQGAEAREMRSLVEDLPAPQREAIELAYFGGLTQAEISQKLDLPLGTVKSRQRLGLTRLREALAREPLAISS